jgi:hypothetical protein
MKHRIDTETVACGKQATPSAVPQRKAEVAGEAIDKSVAPLFVGAQAKSEIGQTLVMDRKTCPQPVTRV